MVWPMMCSHEGWDNNFHHAVAKATQNKLLIYLFETLNVVRRSTVWGQLRSTQLPDSDHESFPVGEWVVGETGWCEYAVGDPAKLRRVDPALAPVSTALGVLGIPGLAAWAGLGTIGRPKKGETVLVSTATGGVGSVAGQLARRAGCRTVGIVGLEDKCQIALDEFGFDACVSYRSPSFVEDLRAACPDGIDVYFDNAGGAVLEVAGAAGIGFDPYNTQDMTAAILRVARDDALAAELRANAIPETARNTWDQAAELTVEALERCVQTRRKCGPTTP